jgi:AcrR family transcriptional regulator
MARVVNEEEYTARRDAILKAAERLIYSKNYEQMSLQDIVDELHVSKGALFHYFRTKAALLEALIDRMLEEGMQQVIPLAHDPSLSALEKLQHFFATLVRWKTAQKTFFLAMLAAWYNDGNAIVRQKVRGKRLKLMGALLTEIIRQGIEQGDLRIPYSDQIGEVALCLVESLVDSLSVLLLTSEPNEDCLHRMEGATVTYTAALERTLGTSEGSLEILSVDALREWFTTAAHNA